MPMQKRHTSKQKTKVVVCEAPCFLILHLSPVGNPLEICKFVNFFGPPFFPSPQGSEKRQGLMAKGQSGVGPALSWRSTRGKLKINGFLLRCFFADEMAHHNFLRDEK